jgi:hypothetical protein
MPFSDAVMVLASGGPPGLLPARQQMAVSLGFDIVLACFGVALPAAAQSGHIQRIHSRPRHRSEIRHGGAHTEAAITASADQQMLTLTIADTGRGFGPATTGNGLTNISDRLAAIGGQLVIDTAPGRGTRITATIFTPAPAHKRVQPSRQPRRLDAGSQLRTCSHAHRA